MARIIVGMSGGVDSSVTAYLLKEQGHDVVGLFMRNWDSIVNNDILGNKGLENSSQCPQEKDWKDAQSVSQKLGIEIHRVDFIKEYWDYVFQHFIDEYKKGRTPNPDILCNKYIKFDAFLKHAFNKLDADYIAMGHYAKQQQGELFRAIDRDKDQSYFLSQLNKEQISKTLFPLSDLKKTEVRAIANQLGLINANKKDSTGICFIGERNFVEFLKNYIPTKPGDILDITNGNVIGKHKGVMYYTVGQRKGLNLGGMSEPYYVAGYDIDQKIIYAAPSSQPQWLQSDMLIASDVNINTEDYDIDNITVKFRYRQESVPATIAFKNDNLIVKYNLFESVTPGQQVVLYDGEKCIGGATIDEIYKSGEKIKYL